MYFGFYHKKKRNTTTKDGAIKDLIKYMFNLARDLYFIGGCPFSLLCLEQIEERKKSKQETCGTNESQGKKMFK